MFFFVLMLNLMGLIPLFSTATSNLAVTAALSMITLGTIVVMGIARHGALGFLKSFAPAGVPFGVLIILFPIEILGVFIKVFALTIRLFANMLAGHIVIFAILGMVLLFGAFVAPPAVLLATAIYFLEIFVAFLQAYIFVLLSSMFIGATLHLEH
jgi:F-type H+-transporting ATPase subunit a